MSENEFIIEQPATDFEEVLDSISSQPQNQDMCSMQDLEKMVDQMIKSLPKLDRIKVRNEMQNMIVPTFETPTTFDINKGLSVAQAYKDRLTEIYNLAMREYKLRKRCMEMLFDAVNLVSKASSADKRKGEATMKYPIFVLQLEGCETFVKEIEQILNNIKSASESISRQGSMIQTQVQLGEYRKRIPGGVGSPDGPNQSEAEEMDYHSGAKKLNMSWDEI